MSIYNSECTRCCLHEHAQHVCMPASGAARYRAIVVGEAPGRSEDANGIPFVGRAGWLLDRALVAAFGTTSAREDVLVTNAVKCRPPGNRTPESDEVDACSTYLAREIEVTDAYVILALGNVAASALLGLTGITSMRGEWHRLDSVADRHVMPTYHPAYVLRNGLDSRTHTEFLSDVEKFAHRAKNTEKDA